MAMAIRGRGPLPPERPIIPYRFADMIQSFQVIRYMKELFANLEKLHTTELGVMRIKRNLCLNTDQVVDWCKSKISVPNAIVTRSGKNWYIDVDHCIITINAHSYTIITAHRKK